MTASDVAFRRSGALRRISALIRKEALQVFRDPSSIAVGIVMPMLLLVLFGYGLSFDVKNVPVALVMEDSSADARGAVSGFELSDYFDAVPVKTMSEARKLLLDKTVNAIVRIPPDFARRIELGDAEIQILVHGTDANTARISLGYAQGAVGTWLAREVARGRALAVSPISIDNRLWFNEANESTYFLVPGLIVLVMTLIGALLTALVMAREWERGTFEALFVTPVRSERGPARQDCPLFRAGDDRACSLGRRQQDSVRSSASGFALHPRRGVDALPVGCAGHRAADFFDDEEPVRGEPDHPGGDLPARHDAVRVHIRPAQHAVGDPGHHLYLPGPLFREPAADLVSRGRYLVRILPNAAVLAVMATLLMSLSVVFTRKRIG